MKKLINVSKNKGAPPPICAWVFKAGANSFQPFTVISIPKLNLNGDIKIVVIKTEFYSTNSRELHLQIYAFKERKLKFISRIKLNPN